jgi:hypothetical protein
MKTSLTCILAIVSLLACQPAIAQQQEYRTIEEWRFSGLTGSNTYLASHSNPGSQPTEQSRSSLRRAMIDNSSMPILKKPIVMEDGISNETQVTVVLKDDSRENPQGPKGFATLKYKNQLGESEDMYIAWRGTHTDTYVMFSDKTVAVYTVHRNVPHPNGGYLLTLNQIGNAPLGVRAYTMYGSARRLK